MQAHIPSDVIDGNVLRLFIPVDISKEDSIRKYANYDSLLTAMKDEDRSNVMLKALSTYYHVYIDDSLLQDLPFLFNFKPKTSQQGYLVYIDITELPKGLHHLQVAGPKAMYKYHFADIPFYRDISESRKEFGPKATEEKEDYFDVKPLLPK